MYESSSIITELQELSANVRQLEQLLFIGLCVFVFFRLMHSLSRKIYFHVYAYTQSRTPCIVQWPGPVSHSLSHVMHTHTQTHILAEQTITLPISDSIHLLSDFIWLDQIERQHWRKMLSSRYAITGAQLNHIKNCVIRLFVQFINLARRQRKPFKSSNREMYLEQLTRLLKLKQLLATLSITTFSISNVCASTTTAKRSTKVY